MTINQAGGTDPSGKPAAPLNWKSALSEDDGASYGAIVDLGANIVPVGSVSLPLTMTGGEVLVTGSLTGLNVFNVISASAGFAISESTVSPTAARELRL